MAVDKKISYEQARKKLNKAAPKGHQLAFITPAEANLLKSKGASGEMTKAGIRSYRGLGAYGGGDEGPASGGGSPDGGNKSQGGLKGLRSSGMVSTSTAPTGPAGAGGLAAPQGPQGKDDSGPEIDPSLTGFVDQYGNPVTYGDEGEQVGFGAGFLSKDTPFSNAALEAALANPNSPSFGAAQTALGMNPSLGQDPAIQAAIVNNPSLNQMAVQMGLKEDPNKPTTPTLASIQQRIDALKKSPFSTPFTPSLASIPTVSPTFAPNLGLGLTQAFAQATDDDADDTSKGLGLSLGEAIAQDFSNLGEAIAGIPSAVYGAVTNPVGTLEEAVKSPGLFGQYAQLSMPTIGPTSIGLSMLNFRPSFNEQGETIGTGYLGGLGVSTHLVFDTDNYGLENEQDRVAFEKSFYDALYSPADNVKGYTVDADAAQAVADQFGATYSGPAVSTASESQEGTRGGPETEAVVASAKPPQEQVGDSGLPERTPEQIQQDLTALYNSMTEQQRATIDKITQLPEYDLGFGVRYILQGGTLF